MFRVGMGQVWGRYGAGMGQAVLPTLTIFL